jgi:hypothetical protein
MVRWFYGLTACLTLAAINPNAKTTTAKAEADLVPATAAQPTPAPDAASTEATDKQADIDEADPFGDVEAVQPPKTPAFNAFPPTSPDPTPALQPTPDVVDVEKLREELQQLRQRRIELLDQENLVRFAEEERKTVRELEAWKKLQEARAALEAIQNEFGDTEAARLANQVLPHIPATSVPTNSRPNNRDVLSPFPHVPNTFGAQNRTNRFAPATTVPRKPGEEAPTREL